MLQNLKKLVAVLLAMMLIAGNVPITALATGDADEMSSSSSGAQGVAGLMGKTVTASFYLTEGDAMPFATLSTAKGDLVEEEHGGYSFETRPVTPTEGQFPAGMLSFRGWAKEGTDTQFDFADTIEGDTRFFAVFGTGYLVQFKNGSGKIDYSLEVKKGTTGFTVPKDAVDKANLTAPDNEILDGWYDGATGQNATFPMTITSNKVFAPRYVNRSIVVFVSEGSQVDPQVVKSGSTAVEPVKPTRDGYDFDYWATDTEGLNRFAFSTPVNAKTHTLYAIWKGKTVNYTIALWLEKPGFAYDEAATPGNISEYNWVVSVPMTGIAGTNTVENSWDEVSKIAAIKSMFNGENGNIMKYGAFQLIEEKKILGNGTSVVNLYAKRKMYTFIFDLGTSKNYTMTVHGDVYKSGTDSPTRKYFLYLKYEMDISNLLPLQGMPWLTFTDASSSKVLNGWYPSADQPDAQGRIQLIRNSLNSALLSRNGQVLEYTLTLSLEAGTARPYRYFVKPYPGQDVSSSTIITVDKVDYVMMEEFNQNWTSGTVATIAKVINGLKNVSYRFFAYKDGEWTISPNGTGAANYRDGDYVCFYYTRLSNPVTFNVGIDAETAKSIKNFPKNVSLLFEEPLTAAKPAIDPTLAGHTFEGWYRDAQYTEKFDFSVLMPNAPMTAYARWKVMDFTVTYYESEGGATVYNEFVANGDTLKRYYEKYEPNYFDANKGVFIGWYYKIGDIPVPFLSDAPVSGNINLYTLWRTTGFTVEYIKAPATGGSVPGDSEKYELKSYARVKIPIDLVKGSEDFYAWQDEGGNVCYPSDSMSINGNKRLTPLFVGKAAAYTVTYIDNFDGSTDSVENIVPMASASEYKVLGKNVFTHANYELVEWRTNADGSGTKYAPDQTGVSDDVTLYGVWKLVNVTVTFNLGVNGTAVGQSLEFPLPKGRNWIEGGVVIPQVTANSGWRLVGWNPDLPAMTAPVNANTTYTAQYQQLFSVSYVYDGQQPNGAPALTDLGGKYVQGETVSVDKDVVLNGYTFSGWRTNIALNQGKFNMPAADVVFTGTFTELAPVSITFAAGKNGTVGNGTANVIQNVNPEIGQPAGTTAVANPGYEFDKWTYEPANGSVDMPNAAAQFAPTKEASDVWVDGMTWQAHFKARTDIDYTVVHNFENLEGNGYDKLETSHPDEARQGEFGATLNPADYIRMETGFTYDATASAEVTVELTGTVLNLYYSRNSYDVTYAYSNADVPENATDLNEDVYAVRSYKFGEAVTIAEDATAPGYNFGGWTIGGEAAASFPMPAEPVAIVGAFTIKGDAVLTFASDDENMGSVSTGSQSLNPDLVLETSVTAIPSDGYEFVKWIDDATEVVVSDAEELKLTQPEGGWVAASYTAVFTARTDISYTVVYNYETLADGVYETLDDHDNIVVTNGEFAATVNPADYAVAGNVDGYTYDTAKSVEVTVGLEGTIVNLYYTRNSYEVTYVYTDVPAIAGTTDLSTDTYAARDYKFGETVEIAAAATARGHIFGGWMIGEDMAANFEMPAYRVVIEGAFDLMDDVEITYVSNSDIMGSVSEDRQMLNPELAEEAGATATANAGYRFKEWRDATGEFVSDEEILELTRPEEGWVAASYTAVFEARTDIGYTVVYNYETLADGDYDVLEGHDDLVVLNGEFAATVNPADYAEAGNVDGYTYDPASPAVTVELEGTIVNLYYTRNSYNVTYMYTNVPMIENATNLIAQASYKFGDDVTIGAAATAPGYNFGGWKIGVNDAVNFTMPAHDVAIEGAFEMMDAVEITYTSANPNMGSVEPGSQLLNPELAKTAGALATANAGYEFAGWSEDGGAFTADTAKLDLTIPGEAWVTAAYIASFRPRTDISYTVVYNYETLAGGDYEPLDGHDDLVVLNGEFASTVNPADYAAAGNEDGFTYDADMSKEVTVGLTGTIVNLYYSRNSYDVTYAYTNPDNTNMMTFSANTAEPAPDNATNLIPPRSYKFGANVRIGAAAKAPGYNFSGWKIGADDAANFTMPANNVAIQGAFVRMSDVEITYASDNSAMGSVDQTSQLLNPELAEEAGATATAADGYRFVEWVDATGKFVSDKAALELTRPEDGWVTASYTAVFAARTDIGYTVAHNFENLAGNGYDKLAAHPDEPWQGEFGSSLTPANYVRKEPGFTYDAAASMEVTVELTGTVLDLYYTRNSYNVTYVYTNVPMIENATNLIAQASYKFGDDVTIGAAATAPGYNFGGWKIGANDAANFTMPAKNVTIEGAFVRKSDVTITYNADRTMGIVNPASQLLNPDLALAAGATATANAGYEFVEWREDNGTFRTNTAGLVLAKPDNGWATKSYTAYFRAKAPVINEAAYAVEYHFQNVDQSGYTENAAARVSGTGAIDSLVAADGFVQQFTGFTYARNDGESNGLHILADGSAVLRLFYDRNSYPVSYFYTNTVLPAGVTALPAPQNVLFGQTVTVAPNATASAATFNGWIRDGKAAPETFTMPAKAINIYGGFALIKAQLNITYAYADTGAQAAISYSTTMSVGETYSVPSPILVGYVADVKTVSGTMSGEDVTLVVTYSASGSKHFAIMDSDVPLAGIASRSVGDCAE